MNMSKYSKLLVSAGKFEYLEKGFHLVTSPGLCFPSLEAVRAEGKGLGWVSPHRPPLLVTASTFVQHPATPICHCATSQAEMASKKTLPLLSFPYPLPRTSHIHFTRLLRWFLFQALMNSSDLNRGGWKEREAFGHPEISGALNINPLQEF